jgi:hypothetical protein
MPNPDLSRTARDGYGYFPASPGLTLKDGRYEVLRMLGSGQTSSVFLVRDLGAATGYMLHLWNWLISDLCGAILKAE